MNRLWCDLKTNEERIAFLESGEACDTGIIAPVMVGEIITLYKKLIAAEDAMQSVYRGGQDEACDAVQEVETAIDSVKDVLWTYPERPKVKTDEPHA